MRRLMIKCMYMYHLLSSYAGGIPRMTEGSAVALLPAITEVSAIAWSRRNSHDHSIAYTYGIIIDLGEGLRGV